jgi:hypothetical protein
MEPVYRSAALRNRGATTPQQPASTLSGYLRDLIGEKQPTYRGSGGKPSTPGSRAEWSWWVFGSSAPAYKVATSGAQPAEAEPTTEICERPPFACVCSDLAPSLEDDGWDEESDEATTEIYVW